MRIAILGLPQSGKKTLFSLLSGRTVPESRKEAEAVEGVARVRDPRVDVIARLVQPEKTKYAETNLVLCPDISAEGAQRDWLETARLCEMLCVVVRAFNAPHVYHPRGSVDPKRDRASLETELLLADLEVVEKRLDRLGKEKRAGHTPAQALEEKVLLKCREALEKEKAVSTLQFEDHELRAIRSLGFVTLLPVLWTYNVDEDQLSGHPWGKDVFIVSCLIEQDIAGFDDARERDDYLHSIGLESSGLDRLNSAAYDTLGLMSFYTMGKDEVRAWTIRKGTRAPEAAGKIHSDIERGFIRVEIICYDDLVAYGSEEAVRKAGKEQVKGRDYVIQDGDICHFRFNV
jgi:ribosome-binding ATPase